MIVGTDISILLWGNSKITTFRPFPPQKWPYSFFGLKMCAMFWNVCKNKFPIFFSCNKNLILSTTKNVVLLRFCSIPELHTFQEILRKPPKKFPNIFFRISRNQFWSSHEIERRKNYVTLNPPVTQIGGGWIPHASRWTARPRPHMLLDWVPSANWLAFMNHGAHTQNNLWWSITKAKFLKCFLCWTLFSMCINVDI